MAVAIAEVVACTKKCVNVGFFFLSLAISFCAYKAYLKTRKIC